MEWIPPRPQWREEGERRDDTKDAFLLPLSSQRPNDGGAGHGFRIDALPSFLSQVATQEHWSSSGV